MSRPIKQRKPNATQFSVSLRDSSIGGPSALAVAERGGDFGLGGRPADQPFDDRRSGVGGDGPYIAHGGAAGGRDRLLGGGKPLMQLRLQPLLRRLGFARLLLPR